MKEDKEGVKDCRWVRWCGVGNPSAFRLHWCSPGPFAKSQRVSNAPSGPGGLNHPGSHQPHAEKADSARLSTGPGALGIGMHIIRFQGGWGGEWISGFVS